MNYCQNQIKCLKSQKVKVISLGLISLDRYLKIVWPFEEFAVQKVKVGQALSAAVWLVSSSVIIPNIILTDKPPPQLIPGQLYCNSLMSEFGQTVYKASICVCQVTHACKLGDILKYSVK